MELSDEFKKLQKVWYKKLKDNGFKDIEDKNTGTLDKGPLKFSNIPHNFWENRGQYKDFFRVIGLYAHHYPHIPLDYKLVLVEYAQCGSLPKALKNTSSKITMRRIGYYVRNTFPEMLKFVNEMDRHNG